MVYWSRQSCCKGPWGVKITSWMRTKLITRLKLCECFVWPKWKESEQLLLAEISWSINMSSLSLGVSLSQDFVARASLQTKLTSGHQRWILHHKQFSIRLRQEKVNPVKHHEAVQSEVPLTGLVVHILLCWHQPATCNLIQWLCISKLCRHASAKSSPLCKVLPSWATVKASGLQGLRAIAM